MSTKLTIKEGEMETNLIDLISDTHLTLRKELDSRWFSEKGDGITRAEGHLMNRLFHEELSISAAARLMNMSRQAVHKCSVELIEKGFLIQKEGASKREKILVLTGKGKAFCRDNLAMKIQLEEDVTVRIGTEKVRLLKELLQEI